MSLYEMIRRPDLKFRRFVPADWPALTTHKNIFDAIRERDVLRITLTNRSRRWWNLVEQAARDAGVLAIKQTLYRTSGDRRSSARSSTPRWLASR